MDSTYKPSRFKRSKVVPRFFQYLILSLVVIFVLMPIAILVFGALKTRGEFMTQPFTPPIPPRWDNIFLILTNPVYSFWRMLRNSVFVMLATTSTVLVICSLAAFVFSRLEFRFKHAMFSLLTVGLMFPINVAILPAYFVLRQLDLIDKLLGVILIQVAFQISGNIMILRSFFASVPTELQDAAYIDGCNSLNFFYYILLPLVRPALASVAALTMIASWNDLLVPLIVLNDDKLWTLPLGTMQFQGQYGQDLALVAAFVVLSAIPTLVFYIVAERQIVSGLTAGAVKG